MPGADAAFGAANEGALDALKPIARALATLFITMIGMMIGCTVGSLAYPMPPAVGAIGGGVICMVLFGCIGCCATGLWREMLPEEVDMSTMVPSVLADQMGGHGSFSMIVTVHKVENIRVSGRLFNKPELYLKLECQHNPVKQTCVRQDGVFEEQFKMEIAASTKSLIFILKDQHLFSSSSVGYICVDVMQDIIQAEFPYQKAFPLESGEEFTLVAGDPPGALIISFDPVDSHLQAGARAVQDSSTAWKAPQYGSVNFLSQLSFNQQAKLDYGKGGPPGAQPGGQPGP